MRVNKNNFRTYFLLILFTVVAFLFACSSQEQLRDLKHFIENLKKNPPQSKDNKDAKFSAPLAVTYRGTTLRAPFAETVSAYQLSKKGPISPLSAFPLSMLKVVGIIDENKKKWAVIAAPDNKIYQITIGDTIGDHYGKVTQIYSDRIEIVEDVTEEGTQSKQRLVTLQIKEESR